MCPTAMECDIVEYFSEVRRENFFDLYKKQNPYITMFIYVYPTLTEYIYRG